MDPTRLRAVLPKAGRERRRFLRRYAADVISALEGYRGSDSRMPWRRRLHGAIGTSELLGFTGVARALRRFAKGAPPSERVARCIDDLRQDIRHCAASFLIPIP